MARRLAGSLSNGAILRADDEFGEMIFPLATAVPPHWREANLPVLGPKSVLAEPWAAAATDVLAEEGIQLDELRIPGIRRPYFGEADRPLFAVADRFELTPTEPDDLGGKKRLKRTVRFDLGRGAYATVVLRALGQ
jgi:tRNA pseudouridine13 synthase